MKKLISLIGCNSSKEAAWRITKLMKDIHFETDIKKISLKWDKDLDCLIENINIERLANNPVEINDQSIRNLLY